jgi:hypothetical protein
MEDQYDVRKVADVWGDDYEVPREDLCSQAEREFFSLNVLKVLVFHDLPV